MCRPASKACVQNLLLVFLIAKGRIVQRSRLGLIHAEDLVQSVFGVWAETAVLLITARILALAAVG